MGGRAERDVGVVARHPGQPTGVAVVDQGGQDAFGDTAGTAGSRRRPAPCRSWLPRATDRRPAAAPASAGRGPGYRGTRPPRDPQAHRHAVAERHDGQFRPVAVRPGRARSARGCTSGYDASHCSSPVVVQVAPVVERDRLEEHADRARRPRRPRRTCAASRPRRPAGTVTRSRGRGCRAGRRSRRRCGSGRRSPSGSRSRRSARPSGCAYCPCGEELQRRRLATELVLGVVQVGEVLDLRDRQQPGDARAEGQPEDGLLVEQRVEHPGRRRMPSAARA